MSGTEDPALAVAGSVRPLAPVVSVAVVNDYEVIVRGVAAMLEPFSDIVTVVELDCNAPVARLVDVALYDAYAMPGLSTDGIDEIVASGAVRCVVLYTWGVTADLLAQARNRGLGGVVDKRTRGRDLAELLRRARAGAFVSSPSGPPSTAADEPARDWPGRRHDLSAREAEIVALIAQGLSNQQIAQRLFLSINSIKFYIRSAYRTMGVTTRAQAVLWAADHDLIPHRLRLLRTPAGFEEDSTPPVHQ